MPEVSVIRRRQALSGFIGRKETCRRFDASHFKDGGSTAGMGGRWSKLKSFGATGTFGGAVKCVDIERNTDGEGRLLGSHRR